MMDCTFDGFLWGIYASNDGTNTNSFFVNQSKIYKQFVWNKYVIMYIVLQLFYPRNFTLEIIQQKDDICDGKSAAYGIDLIQLYTGFAIEENKFLKASGAPSGNYIGIRVTACPSESDVIYLNEFDGVSVGNQAEVNKS